MLGRPWRKRQDSVPVSMMCARWVRRSTTALASRGVGEDLGPFAEGQVGGDDQAAAFVAFGEDLEDELGGAVGQGEVAELVDDDELGAGVARDDAGELAACLGLLGARWRARRAW